MGHRVLGLKRELPRSRYQGVVEAKGSGRTYGWVEESPRDAEEHPRVHHKTESKGK